jgi:hypothetical protein
VRSCNSALTDEPLGVKASWLSPRPNKNIRVEPDGRRARHSSALVLINVAVVVVVVVVDVDFFFKRGRPAGAPPVQRCCEKNKAGLNCVGVLKVELDGYVCHECDVVERGCVRMMGHGRVT